MNPYQVVKDFERAVAEYTGAPYVVAVNSCSAALMLAVAWHLRARGWRYRRPDIEIPKRTYLSVPMSIIHAGGRPTFRDEDWLGAYQLEPLPVWDSARWFSSGMYMQEYRSGSGQITSWESAHAMVCTSHHWNKPLGIEQGGCILHDDPEADAWLRRARFDGRAEGVAPKDDTGIIIGHHCYLSPSVAANGLIRLHHLPKHLPPMPPDDYPDLSTLECFK
jgi:dTDP-4-amino-4,6-dideoxygalactose transaminase